MGRPAPIVMLSAQPASFPAHSPYTHPATSSPYMQPSTPSVPSPYMQPATPPAYTQPSAFVDVELLEPLGDGAQARIYKGRCKRSGRFCALKVSHPKPVCLALLEEEATILQSLDHPNIAKLVGRGKGSYGSYLAMELCSGGDMFDVIDRETRLSERAAARITKQLLEAVAHMHSRNICHRDLKEENLLVAAPGRTEELTIKVCDFGISKRVGGPSRAGLCTPNYGAPELLAGEDGDKAGDLWSCGVILYSLLSGCVPFDGQSRPEVLELVRSEGGPSFREEAWAHVSEGAIDLIRRLLRLEPDERYTAEQALAHPWVAHQAPPGASTKASRPALPTLLGSQSALPTLLGSQSFGRDVMQPTKRVLGETAHFMYTSPTIQSGRDQHRIVCA